MKIYFKINLKAAQCSRRSICDGVYFYTILVVGTNLGCEYRPQTILSSSLG